MNLKIETNNIETIKTEGLIFFVFEKEKPNEELAQIDKVLGGVISDVIRKGYFNGEKKEIRSIHTHGKVTSEQIILVGLGKKEPFDLENMRQCLALSLLFARENLLKKVTIVLPPANLNIIQDLGTVAIMSLYHFISYKTKDCDKIKKINEVSFYTKDKTNISKYKLLLNKAEIIAEAINWTRDLINHPSNFVTPNHLVLVAQKLSSKNLKVKSYGEKKLKKLGMGLILGVSRGSDEEAQLIQLDYQPKKYKETIVLVGKGITFDSGGISIKPSAKMNDMKMDMAGAGVVLGIMKLLKETKPEVRVIGLIPAAENMPSGKAIKPSDILVSASGQTVEIDDTDAEGRLILADALFYAQSFKPSAIIDLATLTGATLIVLGNEAASLIGNNHKLIERIKNSADRSGEKVWELPLWDEYKEMIKSEVADLNNTGKTRNAGVITAAAFLENFVGKFPWVHLDIAGTAMLEKPKDYNQKGASGYGIRLLNDLIENWE